MPKFAHWGVVSVFLVVAMLTMAACSLLLMKAVEVSRDATRSGGGQGSTTPLARGEALYDANCRSCHGGATGGQMMDIPPTHNANGHTWHHPDCQLIDVVLNGSGEMGEMMRRMMGVPEDTPRMPAFKGKLSEEDVEAILAYIKTWWTEEQRQAQARITEGQCG